MELMSEMPNIRIEEEWIAEEYGIEAVENITYSSSVTNDSSEAMKIKAATPDVIMMSSYASDAFLYLKTFKEQNYVPKMLLGQRGGFVQTDFLMQWARIRNLFIPQADGRPTLIQIQANS